MSAAITEDFDGAVSITDAYLKTTEAVESLNRDTWQAHVESLRVRFGKGGSLATLEALAGKHPTNSKILEDYAFALEIYRSFEESAVRFEAAAATSSQQIDTMRLRGLAAQQYVSAGHNKKALEIITELRTIAKSESSYEKQFLDSLRGLLDDDKERDALIAVLERLAELKPDDISTRFSLAYLHNQVGNNDLALNNYLMIPHKDRGSGTWNNLGVAYDAFQIRARAVDAYVKAEEETNTLATSNLANKLVSVGMIKEAMTRCEAALAIENYHKNVTDLISRIKSIPGEEDKKTNDLIEKAGPKRDFYTSLGRAISATQATSLSGLWIGPDCPLEVRLTSDQIQLTGMYEVDPLPYGVLGTLATNPLMKIKVKQRVEYTLTLRGRALDGIVKRTREGETPTPGTSLLASGDDGAKVVAILNEDNTELKIMESPHAATPTFYSIKQFSTKPGSLPAHAN